ncbi:antibiotic biosynthesis monooxygenase [Streptomyces sp. NPDC046261]|uniref:antibiotic biosynthesis monooxygenase n=1 Tax=Streptomyces sp. NPDC046261 TaxID=3157200 RepID=UPI00340858C7
MTRLAAMRHPHAGITLISRWITGGEERSRAAADALLDTWSQGADGDVPAARLATHVFVDEDGSGLLIHGQWTSAEDHLAFVREGRAARVGRIDTLVPGIERPGLHRTRPYREVTVDPGRAADVFAFATYDAEAPGRARARADTRAAALTDAAPPGLLGFHLYLTTDGGRVVELAEWAGTADAVAREAVHGPGTRFYRFHGSRSTR